MAPALLIAVAVMAAPAPPQAAHRHHRTARREVVHRIVIEGSSPAATHAQAAPAAREANATSERPPAGQANAPAPAASQPSSQAEAPPWVADVRQLDAAVNQLQAQLEIERERTAQLEDQAQADRARWQLRVEQPVRRTEALTAELGALSQVDQALAYGSTVVGPDIARARAAIAFAANNAGAGGWEDEANDSAAASRWLAASEEAMSRSDLFQARVALRNGALAAQRARVLAAATAQASTRY